MKLIALTQGKFAMVDDIWYDVLIKWNWCALRDKQNYYAGRGLWVKKKKITIKMHRVIMGCVYGDGKIVDHANRNTLDCQTHNLRFASFTQNCSNKRVIPGTSKYMGVSFKKSNKKWVAQIKFNNSIKYLGLFENEIHAAKAYNDSARIHHGEFANLNVIPENA